MTISYSVSSGGFFRLLFQWRGSIWKLIWRKVLIFVILYALLSIIYREVLDEQHRVAFKHVASYFDSSAQRIPITFLLGFYVSQMVTRWWDQFNWICWPDRFIYFLTTTLRGSDEKLRIIRRNIARYINLTAAITWRSISIRTIKRFPKNEHLVRAGLMTQSEKETIENMDAPNGYYFVPLVWAGNLLAKCKEEGYLDSVQLDRLLDELNTLRGCCGMLLCYDWISIPLVYTQVATIATYGYFLFVLIGRQPSDSYKPYSTPVNASCVGDACEMETKYFDLFVPIFTILEVIFYMGWLSVAEELCNPYGQDDEDFEMNYILDRNVQIAYMVVDDLHMQVAGYEQDIYWNNKNPKMPHTVASSKIKEIIPLGHLSDFHLKPPYDQVLDPNDNADTVHRRQKAHGVQKLLSRLTSKDGGPESQDLTSGRGGKEMSDLA